MSTRQGELMRILDTVQFGVEQTVQFGGGSQIRIALELNVLN